MRPLNGVRKMSDKDSKKRSIKREDDGGFLDDNWKYIVATVYIILIGSLVGILYYTSTTPSREIKSGTPVKIWVHNDSENDTEYTVKLVPNVGFDVPGVVDDFKNKSIAPGEKARFKTRISGIYSSFRYKIWVCYPDQMEDPLVKKPITVIEGEDNVFHITVDR